MLLERYDDAVLKIHEAALEPTRWGDALSVIADITDSSSGTLEPPPARWSRNRTSPIASSLTVNMDHFSGCRSEWVLRLGYAMRKSTRRIPVPKQAKHERSEARMMYVEDQGQEIMRSVVMQNNFIGGLRTHLKREMRGMAAKRQVELMGPPTSPRRSNRLPGACFD